jgi:virginiamycin A acetyltransferase
MIAYRSISELLAFIPGMVGVWMRRAWYKVTLRKCGARLFVDWMAVIRSPATEIGNDVYIGVHSWIGWCSIGDDTMLSGPTFVVSGLETHGMARDRPMREQPCTLQQVHIGKDVWTGSNVTVGADLADGTVVGAGAVVVKPTHPYAVVVGNPARQIKER